MKKHVVGELKKYFRTKRYSAFHLAIELNSRDSWTIHENVESSIDILLQGLEPKVKLN